MSDPAPRPRGDILERVRRRHARRGEVHGLHRSPAFLAATLAHALVLLALSFVSIVVYAEVTHEPIAVKLATSRPVAVAPEAPLLGALEPTPDASEVPPLPEADSQDPFHEALGKSEGTNVESPRALGIGAVGRGGAGRGGDQDQRSGPSAQSEGALVSSLKWLADHRAPDGGWGPLPNSHAKDGRMPRAGDVARTGLGLICFLSAGHSPARDGPYRDVVRRARDWLVDHTSEVGVMTPPNPGDWKSTYHQAIGTLALAEVLQHDPTPKTEAALRRAVKHLLEWQSKDGWRYAKQQQTDTSVTCWAVMALKSAEHAGLEVPEEAWKRVKGYLEKVSQPDGRTLYMQGWSGGDFPGMNATGLFLRIMLGESPDTPRNQAAARLVDQQAVLRRDDLFIYYQLYYAALGLYQVGGETWRTFNPRIRDAVVGQQEVKGCEAGSWNPSGVGWPETGWTWSPGDESEYDRVVHTQLAALILETYYRYLVSPDAPAVATGSNETRETLHRAEEALAAARREGDAGALLAAEAGFEELLKLGATEEERARLRPLALARLAEAAVLAGDPARALGRAEEYLQALPEGEPPSSGLMALRRLAACALATKVAREGDRAAADAAFRAAEELLAKDLSRADEAERREIDGLLAQLRGARLGLEMRSDPEGGLARGLEALKRVPPQGDYSPEERRLLHALLARGCAAFDAAARGDAAAFERGEADLAEAGARRIDERGRIDDPLRALLVEARLRRATALAGIGRAAEAIATARKLAAELPAHAERLVAIERVALMTRIRTGEPLAQDERTRLAELVLAAPRANPDEDLTAGMILVECGRIDDAETLLARADEAPGLDANRKLLARIARVRTARVRGDLDVAERRLERLPAAAKDRLDVRLEKAALLRLRKKPAPALEEYQGLLRALGEERGPDWWRVAEETARTHAESGEVAKARAFLDDLRRVDPALGGEASKARIVRLMLELDQMR